MSKEKLLWILVEDTKAEKKMEPLASLWYRKFEAKTFGGLKDPLDSDRLKKKKATDTRKALCPVSEAGRILW